MLHSAWGWIPASGRSSCRPVPASRLLFSEGQLSDGDDARAYGYPFQIMEAVLRVNDDIKRGW